MSRPEGEVAKKKFPVSQNFRSKEILYLILSTMITLYDPQIFSKISLYTTMRVRGAWNEGKWWGNKIMEEPDR